MDNFNAEDFYDMCVILVIFWGAYAKGLTDGRNER